MQTAHRKRRGSVSESFRFEPDALGQTISTGVPGEGSKPPDGPSAERLLLHCFLVNRFLFSLRSHTAEICFSFAPRKITYPIYFKSAQCRVPARASAVSRSGEITKCVLLKNAALSDINKVGHKNGVYYICVLKAALSSSQFIAVQIKQTADFLSCADLRRHNPEGLTATERGRVVRGDFVFICLSSNKV